jgi:hypothetical protein
MAKLGSFSVREAFWHGFGGGLGSDLNSTNDGRLREAELKNFWRHFDSIASDAGIRTVLASAGKADDRLDPAS